MGRPYAGFPHGNHALRLSTFGLPLITKRWDLFRAVDFIKIEISGAREASGAQNVLDFGFRVQVGVQVSPLPTVDNVQGGLALLAST